MTDDANTPRGTEDVARMSPRRLSARRRNRERDNPEQVRARLLRDREETRRRVVANTEARVRGIGRNR
jgi:adenylate kinase family enzyme